MNMTFRYGHGFLKGQLFIDQQGRGFLVPMKNPSWFDVMPERFKDSLPYRAALLYFIEEHKFMRTVDYSENSITLHDSLKRKWESCELEDAPKVFKTTKFIAISPVPLDNIKLEGPLYVPASSMAEQ